MGSSASCWRFQFQEEDNADSPPERSRQDTVNGPGAVESWQDCAPTSTLSRASQQLRSYDDGGLNDSSQSQAATLDSRPNPLTADSADHRRVLLPSDVEAPACTIATSLARGVQENDSLRQQLLSWGSDSKTRGEQDSTPSSDRPTLGSGGSGGHGSIHISFPGDDVKSSFHTSPFCGITSDLRSVTSWAAPSLLSPVASLPRPDGCSSHQQQQQQNRMLFLNNDQSTTSSSGRMMTSLVTFAATVRIIHGRRETADCASGAKQSTNEHLTQPLEDDVNAAASIPTCSRDHGTQRAAPPSARPLQPQRLVLSCDDDDDDNVEVYYCVSSGNSERPQQVDDGLEAYASLSESPTQEDEIPHVSPDNNGGITLTQQQCIREPDDEKLDASLSSRSLSLKCLAVPVNSGECWVETVPLDVHCADTMRRGRADRRKHQQLMAYTAELVDAF